MTTKRPVRAWMSLALLLCGTLSGCALTMEEDAPQVIPTDFPRELRKVTLPTYRVAPPDILSIEAVHNIRPASDPLRAGDALAIRIGNPEPLDAGVDLGVDAGQAELMEAELRLQKEVRDKYIDGEFRIQTDGKIYLGPVYGAVSVAGMTFEQAKQAIESHLKAYTQDANGQPAGLLDPRISIELPDVSGKQPITGEHLVRPDGTVSLGVYGGLYVAGMTLNEVKHSIETHLAAFVHEPEVSVDVLAYNSKVYYVITDGAGYGESVVRLPCTGNETVLDAISQVDGLSEVSSKEIWIARPSAHDATCSQILEVDWDSIAALGITNTNFQILPGDRVYVKADHMIAADNFIGKVIAPFERVFGFVLLGHGAVRNLQFGHINRGLGGAGGGNF